MNSKNIPDLNRFLIKKEKHNIFILLIRLLIMTKYKIEDEIKEMLVAGESYFCRSTM
jgi:hypothetical protein